MGGWVGGQKNRSTKKKKKKKKKIYIKKIKMENLSASGVEVAEGDLASMRVHVLRLPAGYVKRRLVETMESIEREISQLRNSDFVVVEADGEDATTATVGEGSEDFPARTAREKLDKALNKGEGPRPKNEHEALSLCLHALVASKAEGFPGLRCIGVPKTQTPTETDSGGFAAPVRELERGKLVPVGWNATEKAAFKYRHEGSEILELVCEPKETSLGITLTSNKRGLIHHDDVNVGFQGDIVPAARFEAAAIYVRDLIAPKLIHEHGMLMEEAPPRQYHQQPRHFPRPEEPPLGPFPPRTSGAPFFMDEQRGDLVGPDHPIFVGPQGSGFAAPRYDPMGPNDIAPRFALGPRGGPRRRPAPGEPNFDHLKVPGSGSRHDDDDDDMFI